VAAVFGIISQKGGVGKSTCARLLACEYARNEWRVKIADMDVLQGTSFRWNERRLQNAIQPEIAVEQFSRVAQALRIAHSYDLLIFDGKPHSTRENLDIAKSSDLVLLPTGTALDDLEPTVRLAHELKKHISVDKLAVCFSRVGASSAELEEAVRYVQAAKYFCLSGFLPERTGYRRASDTGRAATETPHSSLNQKADRLAQSVADRMEELK
jgi:chromosome partitioning protein